MSSNQKQIELRAQSRTELTELVPVAVDALMEMGADDVMVSDVMEVISGDGPVTYPPTVLEETFMVSFAVEGLGTGRRFSRQQRKQFREIVTPRVPSRVGGVSFRTAPISALDVQRSAEDIRQRSIEELQKPHPDSDRTRRAKARSKARRKLTRRPNPAESWRYTIRYMDPDDRTSIQYESFVTTKPPRMWLQEAAREGNDQYVDNFRIRDAGEYFTEYIDGVGRQWFISIVPARSA